MVRAAFPFAFLRQCGFANFFYHNLPHLCYAKNAGTIAYPDRYRNVETGRAASRRLVRKIRPSDFQMLRVLQHTGGVHTGAALVRLRILQNHLIVLSLFVKREMKEKRCPAMICGNIVQLNRKKKC